MTNMSIVNGVYKPTYNWGAPSCSVCKVSKNGTESWTCQRGFVWGDSPKEHIGWSPRLKIWRNPVFPPPSSSSDLNISIVSCCLCQHSAILSMKPHDGSESIHVRRTRSERLTSLLLLPTWMIWWNFQPRPSPEALLIPLVRQRKATAEVEPILGSHVFFCEVFLSYKLCNGCIVFQCIYFIILNIFWILSKISGCFKKSEVIYIYTHRIHGAGIYANMTGVY